MQERETVAGIDYEREESTDLDEDVGRADELLPTKASHGRIRGARGHCVHCRRRICRASRLELQLKF